MSIQSGNSIIDSIGDSVSSVLLLSRNTWIVIALIWILLFFFWAWLVPETESVWDKMTGHGATPPPPPPATT